jgi:hypothetical protein
MTAVFPPVEAGIAKKDRRPIEFRISRRCEAAVAGLRHDPCLEPPLDLALPVSRLYAEGGFDPMHVQRHRLRLISG